MHIRSISPKLHTKQMKLFQKCRIYALCITQTQDAIKIT